MKFRYLLLLFLPAIFACQNDDDATVIDTPPPPPTTENVTYLALGDSYTIGQSVAETERFPNQLADSLRQNGLEVAKPIIVARTGWTTDELATGIEEANLDGQEFDLVSLLIGVNNQYRGRPVETYRPEFTDLLQQAIGFAGGDAGRVFVVSIPDYAFTPFGNGDPQTSAEIDEYNAANREIAEQFGVTYFDITPLSRQGLDEPELVADDALHPSGEQYSRWVSLMVEEVVEMVE